jgi:hypothetical protein
MAFVSQRIRAKAGFNGKKYDGQFKVVFEAIRLLMKEEVKPKHKLGF